jgi:hypothetical protein
MILAASGYNAPGTTSSAWQICHVLDLAPAATRGKVLAVYLEKVTFVQNLGPPVLYLTELHMREKRGTTRANRPHINFSFYGLKPYSN